MPNLVATACASSPPPLTRTTRSTFSGLENFWIGAMISSLWRGSGKYCSNALPFTSMIPVPFLKRTEETAVFLRPIPMVSCSCAILNPLNVYRGRLLSGHIMIRAFVNPQFFHLLAAEAGFGHHTLDSVHQDILRVTSHESLIRDLSSAADKARIP